MGQDALTMSTSLPFLPHTVSDVSPPWSSFRELGLSGSRTRTPFSPFRQAYRVSPS